MTKDKVDLPGAILTCVQQHSGGMKFTELVSVLIVNGWHLTPDEVLKALKTDENLVKELGVLEYVWHMDPWMDRQKLFIYQKPHYSCDGHTQ